MEKKGVFAEFKDFILRGNVVDLAVAVIIGGAFQGIVKSLVDDIIMPVVTMATGGISFENWFVSLDGGSYASLAAAQEAGAATLNYGVFISTVIQFIIMAFVIFMMIRVLNKLSNKVKKAEEPVVEAAPTTKICEYCKSEIAIGASRCPQCTSDLNC